MTTNLAIEESPQIKNPLAKEPKLQLEVLKLLEHTKCEFEKILNCDGEVLLYEWLARPDPTKMDLTKSDVHPNKLALEKLLNLVEITGTTFLLFYHMLQEIGKTALSDTWLKSEFSINAYAADVENPLFIRAIKECWFADRLTIELTEKKTWSEAAIDNLLLVQEKYNVKISMDDINPLASDKNFSLKNLEKFKNKSCFVDTGKIDGIYFQNLCKKWNYEWLKSHISYLHKYYKLTDFVIEWIENEEQFELAKQLEKDFPEFTFGYQGFEFKKDKYNKKTIS